MTSTDPCSRGTRTVAAGGQLQTGGLAAIENAAACPTSNPNGAPGPGTDREATEARQTILPPRVHTPTFMSYNPIRLHSTLGYLSPKEYEMIFDQEGREAG